MPILLFFIFIFSQLISADEIIVPTGFSLKAEIKMESMESEYGKFQFIIVNTVGYLSPDAEESYLKSIVNTINEKENKIFVFRPSGYLPAFQSVGLKLFSSEKEEGKFQWYLHDLCFDRRILLSQDAEYALYTHRIKECYIHQTRNFLSGNMTQWKIYRYFGQLPDWSETSDFLWGFILYLLLFISSLFHLFLFLTIFSFFQKYFKDKEYNRKLVTVLVPFCWGFLWVFLSIQLAETNRWNFWGMGIWKNIFYLSGLFFGLGFVGVRLLVNRIFYQEEDSASNWMIGLILLFSPILIFAAGAALGGKRKNSPYASTSSNSSNDNSNSFKGGKSGGGGTGGNF